MELDKVKNGNKVRQWDDTTGCGKEIIVTLKSPYTFTCGKDFKFFNTSAEAVKGIESITDKESALNDKAIHEAKVTLQDMAKDEPFAVVAQKRKRRTKAQMAQDAKRKLN